MRARLLAAAAPLVAFAVGCGPRFDHLDMAAQTVPPLEVTLSSTQIALPVGVAVDVNAVPVKDNGQQFDNDVPVALASSAPTILGVAPVAQGEQLLGDDHATIRHRWVLFGVHEGAAQLQINVDGDDEPPIPVVVTAQ